ncbi:MAG: hypothetical protein QOG43_70 [Actinomycetota bacterium]|jgi:hypothetical protein|nr:hypothetical protein [Actinomycetota bacterium]
MAAMRARIFLATTAVALLVAGCSGGGGDKPATTTTSSAAVTTVPVVTTSGATTVPGATTTPTTPTTTPAAAAAAVVLRPDGLGVVGFGATKDATLTALSAAFGPVDETGTGCELAGPDVTTARWDELRVQFVGTTFDSYNVRPPNGGEPVLGLKTEAGVGVGSTVAQLQAAYGSRLTIPGLPPEFGTDNFAIAFPGTDRIILGSLSSTTPAGLVRDVFTQACE